MVSKYIAVFVVLQFVALMATATSICPACIPQAGCQRAGCPCVGTDGAYYYPPNVPQNISPRPAGCVECGKQLCVVAEFKCMTPLPCGAANLGWVVRPGFGPQLI